MADVPEGPEEVEIDMTPMIDVTFLLIVFFMVVSDMSALDVADLTLPFASEAHSSKGIDLEENPTLVVNVLTKGDIQIGGQAYGIKPGGGLRTLKDYLKIEVEAAGREPAPADNPTLRPSKLRILIRADRDTRFENVQNVFDACQQNGIYKTVLGATKDNPK